MNTKIGWIIVIVLAAVIVVVGIFVLYAPSANNVPENIPAGETPPKVTGLAHRIQIKGNEFIPQELTIKAGDEVVFENEDAEAHWPASGIHPTHLLCPGFDSLRPIGKSESYSHIFKKAGTCPMHDHLMPTMRGKIIIE